MNTSMNIQMNDQKRLQQNQTIIEAVQWVTNGISVIPCRPADKRPALKQWGKYQVKLPTAAEIKLWFSSYEGRINNLAVVTGWKGLVVIDFDDFYKYLEWKDYIDSHFPDAMETYQTMTGRGVHVYFRVHNPVKNMKLDRIDLKSSGGYVLAPPSIHPSGSPYWAFCDYPIKKILSIRQVLPARWLDKDNEGIGSSGIGSVREIMPNRTASESYKIMDQADRDILRNRFSPRTSNLPFNAPINDPWSIAENPGNSEDVITRIRKQISILNYFPDAVKTGPNFYLACCPFHDDHNPSFWINTELRICNCYKCQFTPVFDVINLHAALNNLTNAEAIKELGRLLIK